MTVVAGIGLAIEHGLREKEEGTGRVSGGEVRGRGAATGRLRATGAGPCALIFSAGDASEIVAGGVWRVDCDV